MLNYTRKRRHDTNKKTTNDKHRIQEKVAAENYKMMMTMTMRMIMTMLIITTTINV